jgi:hypothetical protein
VTEVTLISREALERARVARQVVYLQREAITAPRVDGVPLAIGPELVLLAVVQDWQFDGYAIVRLADIGPVVDVRGEAVLLHYVGATADWDAEPSEIAFANVTRVQFEDRYSSVFARYAEATRPVA